MVSNLFRRGKDTDVIFSDLRKSGIKPKALKWESGGRPLIFWFFFIKKKEQ